MSERDTAAKSKTRRSESKLKPMRKPLRDVSNKKKSALNKTAQKQTHHDDDYSLDRLLLVQSEISSLLHQIDGLVVQAFKLESMGEVEKKEIKSFTQFLTGTLDSLKPWVPRFEKVLGTACKMSSKLRCQEIKCEPAGFKEEDESDVVKSPEVVKTKSLVSPSPLVSWRDNCTVQRGKRLFLLTPLPKSTAKSVLCNQNKSVKSVFERFNSAAEIIPRFGLTEITCEDFQKKPLETPLVEGTYSSIAIAKNEKSPCCKLASTPTFSLKNCSMLVMTPRFKMSPPKSCVLLEPVYESSRHDNALATHKSTPYPAQLQYSGGSEASLFSSQVTEDMALKYPALVGINSHSNLGTVQKEADASLSWFMSPPKTCVLMEPSDVKIQNKLGATAQLPANIAESTLFPAQRNNVKKSSFQGMVSNGLTEGTPMWKNLESTMRSGKRPGENTLKKELWTKFEAASIDDFSFNTSAVEDDSHKGFLDRLEEVSGEETTPLACALKYRT